MKHIDQLVPAGKILDVAGVRFVGPCRAKAAVPKKAVSKLSDAPKPPKPKPRAIEKFDDLTEREKLAGLLETLSATQKGKIVTAIKAKQPAWKTPGHRVPVPE